MKHGKTWVCLLALVAAATIALPATAQTASCTGWCYLNSSGPYCGFTALQEGGKCSVSYDIWLGYTCTLRACSGGPGWEPENQGRLDHLFDSPADEPLASRHDRIRVTILEPRT